MKKTLNVTARFGPDDLSHHERNQRIKGERDRRIRKTLRHPRYADADSGWEGYPDAQSSPAGRV